jgi:hypothetical protein
MEKFLKLVAHFLAASKHKREGAIQACVGRRAQPSLESRSPEPIKIIRASTRLSLLWWTTRFRVQLARQCEC